MRKLSIGFGVVLLTVFGVAFYVAMEFHPLARYYPLVATSIGIVLSILFLGQELRAARAEAAETAGFVAQDEEAVKREEVLESHGTTPENAGQDSKSTEHEQSGSMEETGIRRTLPYLGWFVGYVVLIRVVGIFVATALFLWMFLYLQARMRWWGILISVVVVVGFLQLMGDFMDLHWPASFLGWE